MPAQDDRRTQRLAQLRLLAEREGLIRLADAARTLGVSTMTIRRDLATGASGLELLGGHIVDQRRAPAYTLHIEQASHAAAKLAAGRRAAAMVSAGDTIFLDCGTTMPHLVASLPADLDVTIVCYALNIANAASRMRRAQLFLLGGLFHASSATFYGEDTQRQVERLGIGKAFLSAGGVHQTRGATCSNFNEVPVKQAVLRTATSAYLVVDGSKIGQVKPAWFASLEAFDAIVTEAS